MKSNSLPQNFTTAYKILRFLKNRPKVDFEGLSNYNFEGSLDYIEIQNIEICKNQKINKLFKKLRPYSDYVQVFLHGSYADDTTTAFSDIDDFIIIDLKELRKNRILSKVMNILNEIDMEFSRIDSIQHHGHWICSKEELKNYDNSFLPLQIIEDSKCVIGDNSIRGYVNTEISEEGLKNNIQNTCKGIKRLSDLYFRNKINAYQLKCLVGSFVLMPAFILQAQGENCTKPEAINRAKKNLSEKSLACIEWSTNCRNNWETISETQKFKRFSFFSQVFKDPFLWRRYSNKFSPKVSKNQKNAISNISLKKVSVEKFISESLEYA
jgi:predicted nucleotidyltransferase